MAVDTNRQINQIADKFYWWMMPGILTTLRLAYDVLKWAPFWYMLLKRYKKLTMLHVKIKVICSWKPDSCILHYIPSNNNMSKMDLSNNSCIIFAAITFFFAICVLIVSIVHTLIQWEKTTVIRKLLCF